MLSIRSVRAVALDISTLCFEGIKFFEEGLSFLEPTDLGLFKGISQSLIFRLGGN